MENSREKVINHLADIVASVFAAEHAVIDKWIQRLRDAKSMPDEERTKVCDDYVRAVAEELVAMYTDDQLKSLYAEDIDNL